MAPGQIPDGVVQASIECDCMCLKFEGNLLSDVVVLNNDEHPKRCGNSWA
jgi:hypothetical protein